MWCKNPEVNIHLRGLITSGHDEAHLLQRLMLIFCRGEVDLSRLRLCDCPQKRVHFFGTSCIRFVLRVIGHQRHVRSIKKWHYKSFVYQL